MRKKWIPVVVLTTVLTAGLSAALAVPGSANDPFVTRSYIADTYYAQSEEAILQRVQSAAAQIAQPALDELENLAAGYQLTAGGESSAAAFSPISLARRERLLLSPGSSLLVQGGQGRLIVDSGLLVDVTAGSETAAGSVLKTGHRYVAAEGGACSLTAGGAGVSLFVQGYYAQEDAGEVQLPFTDLTQAHWSYSSVCYVYEMGLFQGVSPTQFDPEGSMDRAMMVTVLSRLAGVEETAPDAGFRDIPAGEWYANPVNWAAQAGIVNGVGDKLFAPNLAISREEMATMLCRYARDYLGLDVSASGDLTAFSDWTSVSDWAEQAVSWAVGVGLMQGDGVRLTPSDTATRAEVAALLERFANMLS